MNAHLKKICKVCGGPVSHKSVYLICRKTTACDTARKAEWKRRHPEKAKQYIVNYESAHRVENVLRSMRNRVLKQGYSFGLEISSLPEQPKCCPCCGVFMKRGGDRNVTPNLDKIIPRLGYVPGNVQWLCGRCNRIKQDASPEELMKLALFVARVAEHVK